MRQKSARNFRKIPSNLDRNPHPPLDRPPHRAPRGGGDRLGGPAGKDKPARFTAEQVRKSAQIALPLVVAIIAVVFVGVFVDSNRSADVAAYGLGAGALVIGLAVFAYATRKPTK